MKATIKEINAKPKKRITLTLSEKEAGMLMSLAYSVNWFVDIDDKQSEGSVFARTLYDTLTEEGVKEATGMFDGAELEPTR